MTKKGASNGAAETAAQALSNAPELSIDEALWQIAGDLLSNFQEGSNQSDAPEDPRQDGSDDPALTSSMGGSLLQKNTLELLKNQSLNRDQLVAILKAKIGTSFESAGAPEMAETKEDEEVVLEKSRVILHPSGKKVVSAGLMEKLSKLVQKDQPKVLSAALLDLIGSERTEDWRSHEALLRQLLHEACRCDAVHVAEMLLDCSRFPAVSIDDCDERRRTALHHAAECHSLECIELLIKRRAKVDLEDDTGCTPLESAMQSLRPPLDVDHAPPRDVVIKLQEMDLTAIKLLGNQMKDLARFGCELALACKLVPLISLYIHFGKAIMNTVLQHPDFGEGTVVDFLVQKALAQARENPEGGPRARAPVLRVLEAVLRWKPHLSRRKNDRPKGFAPLSKGPTAPLIKAAQANDEALVALLLRFGSDPNEADPDGNTALHWCLRLGKNLLNVSIVQQLSDGGARGSIGNKIGATAIHVAAAHGHYEALKILLTKEPAAVNIVAATKETAIFWAVKNDHVECARLLLQAGANRLLVNLRKQRPIDVATSAPMREMLRQPDEAFTGKDNVLAEAVEAARKGTKEGEQTRPSSAKTVMMPSNAKTELCRYFGTAHGCARGDKCFFAHGEHELVPLAPPKGVVGDAAEPGSLSRQKLKQWKTEDFNRKIFVGGLPESADADDLKEYFESNFGPVDDAIVIGSQTATGMHSRGFGFVAFKSEVTAQKACRQHYVVIFGKKVEVKAAVPRPDSLVWEEPPECKTPDTPASVLVRIPESPADGMSSPESERLTSQHVPNPVSLARAAAAAAAPSPEPVPWEVNSWEEKRLQSPWQKPPAIVKPLDAPPLSPTGTETPPAETRDEANGRVTSPEQNPPAPELSPPPPVAIPGSVKCPPWLVKLRQWLPGYLSTKRGVQYAMSSLKGDFRACFGLEIPHHELGFVKLSDFLRSMPDVVKMKIVPTGTGASTHVVLMPRSPRAAAPPPPPKSPTKFVSTGRSYALAAQGEKGQSKEGEGSGPVPEKPTEVPEQESVPASKGEENGNVEEMNGTAELGEAEANRPQTPTEPQPTEEQSAGRAEGDLKAGEMTPPAASPAAKPFPSTPDLSEGPPSSLLTAFTPLPPRTPTPNPAARGNSTEPEVGDPFAFPGRRSAPEPLQVPPGFGFRKEDREFYLGSPTPEPFSPNEIHRELSLGAAARQLFNSPRSPQEIDREMFEHEMLLQRMAQHPGLVPGRRSPAPHPLRGPSAYTGSPSPLRPQNFDHLLRQPTPPGAPPGDRYRRSEFNRPQNAFDFRSLTPDGRTRTFTESPVPDMGGVLQGRLGAIGGGISPGRALVEGSRYGEAGIHSGGLFQPEQAREWTPFGAREAPTARSFLSFMDWKPPPAAAPAPPPSRAPRVPPENACRRCWERRVTWAALPCGHRCLCTACKEEAVGNPSFVECNVCRSVVYRWVPLFEDGF